MNHANRELDPVEIVSKRPGRQNRLRRLAATGALACLAFMAGSAKPLNASENGGIIAVGGFDSIGEQPDPSVANKIIGKIARVGFDDLKELVTWVPGQKAISANDQQALQNSFTAANANNLQVSLLFAPKTWGENAAPPPLNPNQQRNFCDLVSSVIKDFPEVAAVQIGNEQGNPLFWPQQFKPDGTDAVAVPYEALLTRCYDNVKAIDPNIMVIGGGLRPWGNDNPHDAHPSHSPTSFIANLGAAYKASGRTQPIMDAFGLHPYIANGDTLETTHPTPSTTIGAADYPKLVKDLGQAFDFPGSGQEGAALPIIYDEFAERSLDLNGKNSVRTVTGASRAQDYNDLLHMARCDQPTVFKVNFFKVFDNPQWDSGQYSQNGLPKPEFNAVQSAVIAAGQQNTAEYCA